MKVYYFGNELVKEERKIFEIVRFLKKRIKNVKFVHLWPEELLKIKENEIIILDFCKNVKKCVFVDESFLKTKKIFSLHDFDVSFFIKLIKKFDESKKFYFLLIPFEDFEIEELVSLINSISKKWAEQEKHGS